MSTAHLSAAIVSAAVGLLCTPWMHKAIRQTPIHLPVHLLQTTCARCGVEQPFIANFGLLASLIGKGRCATCGQKVWRDVGRLEIATVVLLALVGFCFGWAPALPAFWLFFIVGLVITVIDLREYVIPTRIVYPSLGLGLIALVVAAAVGGGWSRLLWAVIAMFGLWIFYFFIWFVQPSGMGFGDVRLALFVGLFTGWLGTGNTVAALLIGLFASAVVGILLVIVKVRTRKQAIPHGPFMIFGAAFAILAAPQLQQLVSSVS